MKTLFKMFFLSVGFAGLLTSCESEAPDYGKKENAKTGLVNLVVSTDNSFEKQATRALSILEQTYENVADYQVVIKNTGTGEVLYNDKYSNLSAVMPMALSNGVYSVEASKGTESAYSQTNFLVTSKKEFSLNGESDLKVSLVCSPTCGKVSVTFDSEMADYFEAYSVDFSGTTALGQGKFTWASDEELPYYIALQESGETVSYTINLTVKEDYQQNSTNKAVCSGTFKLNRNRSHVLNVKPNYTPTANGELELSIQIDETTTDHPFEFKVPISWVK